MEILYFYRRLAALRVFCARRPAHAPKVPASYGFVRVASGHGKPLGFGADLWLGTYDRDLFAIDATGSGDQAHLYARQHVRRVRKCQRSQTAGKHHGAQRWQSIRQNLPRYSAGPVIRDGDSRQSAVGVKR